MELMEPPVSEDVRAGYKRTEIGVIPEEWVVHPLHSLTHKVTVGIASAATHAYRDSGIVLFRNQNIKPNRLDDSDILYINAEYELGYKTKRLKAGDLLTARTGYPGTTCVVPEKYEGAQSFTTLISRPDTERIDPYYLSRYINSSSGQTYIDACQIGGGQKNVNAASLREMPIPVPPTREEQEAIATALSDADALLTSLEQLIAKKKAIKQGAMQALLTPPGQPGHKRLPGFKGEWEVKEMHQLGLPYGGLTGKSKVDFGVGHARYIPFMNIMNGPVIDTSFLEAVRVGSGEAQNKALKGDLFFNGSSETPEEVGMCSLLTEEIPDLYLNSFSFGFRLHSGIKASGLFLAYWFRSSAGRRVIYSSAQGATRYNLAKANFLKLEMPYPKPEEQEAIAEVLADMDAELIAYEAKLEKLRKVKQGMMQELLTGKKRLV